MTTPSDTPPHDYIARVARAIWETEGRPDGHDLEHWMRAKQLIEDGRAESEYPEATAPGDADDRAPRRVQPGFEDAAPGMVTRMKADPLTDIREDAGGRFADQLGAAPERRKRETPGLRNPPPEPPTNADVYVAIASNEDAAGGALSDDPAAPYRGW
jgi:hypothetical protein